MISIKANCIDSTVHAETVFAREVKKIKEEKIKPKEQLILEPYERDVEKNLPTEIMHWLLEFIDLLLKNQSHNKFYF